MRREKGKASHARREVREARFRCKASSKDGEKLVQHESEWSDEQCKKRKERS